jgi:uncharacterized protein (TIGR02301 family)
MTPTSPLPGRRSRIAVALRLAAAGLLLALGCGAAAGQAPDYQDRMLRLSEILGAVHHLRDICGADEGQLWREQMMAILDSEDPSTQFRARLIAAFNNGYRGFQRTYASCTPSAKTAADRFFAEGSQLAVSLAQTLEAPVEEGGDEPEPEDEPADGSG